MIDFMDLDAIKVSQDPSISKRGNQEGNCV